MNEETLQKMVLPVPEGGFSWMPLSASEQAQYVDDPFYVIYWATLICFVLTAIPMFYFFVKYKRKTADQKATSQLDHHLLMELSWTVLPLFFFAYIFYIGFVGYMEMYTPTGSEMEVKVTGQKWMWTTEYDCGYVGQPGKTFSMGEAGAEFPMPLDTPTKVVLTATDVLHSFFVPNFRTKMDAMPWRYTTTYFTPNKLGVFPVFCTEYCGKDHSNMIATIKVVPKEEWVGWLKGECEAAGGAASWEKGKELFTAKACLGCHSLDGSRMVGPSFKGMWGREEKLADGTTAKVDRDYFLESLLEPNKKVVESYPAAMPPQTTLTKTEIESLILFAQSPEGPAGGGAEAPAPAPAPDAANPETADAGPEGK